MEEIILFCGEFDCNALCQNADFCRNKSLREKNPPKMEKNRRGLFIIRFYEGGFFIFGRERNDGTSSPRDGASSHRGASPRCCRS